MNLAEDVQVLETFAHRTVGKHSVYNKVYIIIIIATTNFCYQNLVCTIHNNLSEEKRLKKSEMCVPLC